MKRNLTKKWVLAFSVLAGICLYSANSFAESAQVLPQGRSRFSFTYAQTDGITQNFTDHGTRESVVAPYEVQLNSDVIAKAEPRFAAIVSGLNSTGLRYDASKRNDSNHGVSADANGPLIGDAFSRGYLSLDGVAHQQVYATSYAYGVTNRLTIGFVIPVKKSRVDGGASIAGLNQASDIAKQVGNSKLGDISSAMQLVSGANVQTVKDILTSRGYSDATSWSGSGLGDVALGSRYNYMASPHDRFLGTFQAAVMAPTGKMRDPSQPLSLDQGSGAWYADLEHVFNFNPTHWLTLSNGTHYGKYLANQRQIRTAPGDFLPSADDQESVRVQQGDKYSTNFGMDIHVTEALTFNSSYEFAWQKLSNYQGSKNIDYSYLSMDTNTFVEVAQAGISLSSLPSFLRKEFPAPMGVSVNFYVPTTGKSVPIVPYGTAELDLYF